MNKQVGRVLMVMVGAAALGLPALVRAKGPAPATGSAIMRPQGDIEFTDVPNFKGLHMATLEGEPKTGPSHIMLKFDGGFSAPLHHHTSDHYVTVVAGTMVLTVDGKSTRLPAGSYFQFTGKAPHTTACEAGADCLISLDVRGKWDVVPEKTMAAK